MGLKINRSTGFKRPLTIRDTFTVMVRHRTKTEQEQFAEGIRTGNVGEEEAAKQCADYFLIAGECSGLTPSIARQLGVAVADDQEVDADGFIEIDQSVLADLWRHSYAEGFANMVLAFSRGMLSAIEREKEAAKNG